MSPLKVSLSLAGIVLIIIACYYVTYYIGAKASGQTRGRLRNKYINLIDRFSFARDKSFCIVEIAEKVYIIGVTNQTMVLLDTLDAAAFKEAAAERRDTATFFNTQGKGLKDKLTGSLAAFMASKMGAAPARGGDTDAGSFSASMSSAREKSVSEESENEQTEHKDV